MKVKNIENQIVLICEECGEPFKDGESFNLSVLDRKVTKIDMYEGIIYPYTDHIPISDNNFRHVSCETNKVLTVDDIKTGINSLTNKDQHSVYLYLRDTWGHRL